MARIGVAEVLIEPDFSALTGAGFRSRIASFSRSAGRTLNTGLTAETKKATGATKQLATATHSVTTAETAQARAVRATGASYREVAKAMGIAESKARILAADGQRQSRAMGRIGKSTSAASGTTKTFGDRTRTLGTRLRSAAGYAAGAAAAYLSISQAKAAIDTTQDLAKTTIGLNRNLGIGTKVASEWANVLKARGSDTQKTGMAFKTFATQVEAAKNGTASAVDQFKALGVSQRELEKTNVQGLLLRTADGMKNLGAGTSRTAIQSKLFGRGWQTIAPVLRDGSAAVRDQLDAVDQFGGVLEGKTLKQQEALLASLRKSKLAWQGLQVKLMNEITPALKDMSNEFQGIARIVADPKLERKEKITKVADRIQHAFEDALDVILDLIPEIASRVGEQAPKIATALVEGFLRANIWGKFLIGGWLITKLGGEGTLSKLGAKAGKKLGIAFAESALGSMLLERFGLASLIPGGGPTLDRTGREGGMRFGKAMTIGIIAGLVLGTAELIVFIKRRFGRKINEGFRDAGKAVDRFAAKFGPLKGIVRGVLGGILSNIRNLWRGISHAAQIVDDIIHGRWKRAWEDFKSLFQDAINFVKGKAKLLVLPEILAFRALRGAIERVGASLKGIAGTISGAFGRVKRIIKNTIGFIIDKIRDAIGVIDKLKSAISSIPSPGDVGGGIVSGVKKIVPGIATGGLITKTGVRRFQVGGPVGTDSVPALLTPGEFVINAPSARRIGLGVLRSLNRFQTGGLVGRLRRRRRQHDDELAGADIAGSLEAEARRIERPTRKIRDAVAGIFRSSDKVGKDARRALGDHFEGLDKDVSKSAKRLRVNVADEFQTTKKKATDASDQLKKRSSDDFAAASKTAIERTQKARRDVVDGYDQMRSRTLDSTQRMKQGVGGDFKAMSGAVRDGLSRIAKMTNNALGALGVKKVEFNIAGARGHQRGGHIDAVGAPPTGDHIPALLEKNEFVVNQKATRKHRGLLERINRDPSRFQTGGIVGGIQRFAKGGMAAMVAEANKFERRHFPYSWGGGHGGFGIQPVDCSGAVSDVLHAGGLLNKPMVSGALMNWGKPGRGAVTVFSNPHHVVMSLNGRVFGTSGSNPGGGAGWIDGAKGEQLAPGAVRTMDVKGLAREVKRLLVKGPAGPLRDMGQATVDKVRGAANRFIEKKTPSGAFGGGQDLLENFKGGKIVGASSYGFGEPGTGTVGASGVSLPGKMAFAELDMGTALGHLPFGAKLLVGYHGKAVKAEKLDIGAGGGSVKGKHRSIDLWRDLANRIGFGRNLDLVQIKKAQRGGLIAPYVGSFAGGGFVPHTGLGLLHRDEFVVPKMQTGGTVAPRRRHHGDDDEDKKSGGTLRAVQKLRKMIAKNTKTIAKLDERIDIAGQLAGLTSSPGGSETTKREADTQIRLNERLLKVLKDSYRSARLGIRQAGRADDRLDDRSRRLEHKIKHEGRKKKPDQKQISKWRSELRAVTGQRGRFRSLVQAFTESSTEFAGVTGRGGRIFDTKIAIDELKAAGAPQALHISELLDFAEALRFGTFKGAGLPAFARGGTMQRGGLAIVGEQGPEIVAMPGQSKVSPTGGDVHLEARVWIGDREITDIVKTEVKAKDRAVTRRYRAGVTGR